MFWGHMKTWPLVGKPGDRKEARPLGRHRCAVQQRVFKSSEANAAALRRFQTLLDVALQAGPRPPVCIGRKGL